MPSIHNLGAEFPNLAVDTQLGPMKVWDYQGDSWLIFFSHPKDYTPGAWRPAACARIIPFHAASARATRLGTRRAPNLTRARPSQSSHAG